MRSEAIRVVYENRPYLVTRADDGGLDRAYGPFTPGTEPSFAECTSETEVRDASVRSALQDLMPISPVVPPSDDTLAAS